MLSQSQGDRGPLSIKTGCREKEERGSREDKGGLEGKVKRLAGLYGAGWAGTGAVILYHCRRDF